MEWDGECRKNLSLYGILTYNSGHFKSVKEKMDFPGNEGKIIGYMKKIKLSPKSA